MSSSFTRDSLVFNEYFETFTGWNAVGLCNASQFGDPVDAVSVDNVTRKTVNNASNGRNKQLDKS